MKREFDRFYAKLTPGSVALVFFGGYAIQAARQSYIIPVDGQIWRETDVPRDGVSLESILREMNSRGAKVKIAIIDASRRNPYERRIRRFSTGLAPVDAPTGSLVMYSSAPSTVVSDTGNEQRLFLTELVKQLRVPELPAEEVFNRTRMSVSRGTQGQQVPWVSNSLVSDFSFDLAEQVRRRGRADVAAWHIRARIPRTGRDGRARRDARATAGVGNYSEDGSGRSRFQIGAQARSGGVVAGIAPTRVVVIHRCRSGRGEDSPGGH